MPSQKGKIDPSASFEKIKVDIVKAFQLGNPDDFEMAFKPASKKTSPSNYKPTEGDTFIISRIGDFNGTSFIKLES